MRFLRKLRLVVGGFCGIGELLCIAGMAAFGWFVLVDCPGGGVFLGDLREGFPEVGCFRGTSGRQDLVFFAYRFVYNLYFVRGDVVDFDDVIFGVF